MPSLRGMTADGFFIPSAAAAAAIAFTRFFEMKGWSPATTKLIGVVEAVSPA